MNELLLSSLPVANAADGSVAAQFGAVVNPIIQAVVYPIVEVMVAIAIVVFVWGIVEMIAQGDSEEARKKGKTHMIAGIIGMFIMLSAWGIIYLVSNTLKELAGNGTSSGNVQTIDTPTNQQCTSLFC